jgi:hypothetical protein
MLREMNDDWRLQIELEDEGHLAGMVNGSTPRNSRTSSATPSATK